MSSFIQPDNIMRGTHDWTVKTANRFFFSFEEDPTTKLLVRGAGRPSGSFSEIRIPHPNKVRYQSGRVEYEPVNLTLMDYVAPSAAQFVQEWLLTHSESYTGRDGYPAFYRRQCAIELFGASGDVIERIDYLNCKINSFDFGTTDFDSEEPLQITLTVRYDDYILRF